MGDDARTSGSRRISLPGRRRQSAPVAAPPPAATAAPAPGAATGKGRPTPKRSEAQRRRGGPVPPPPTSRREAAKRLRASQAERRRDVRAGTAAGDPARMTARDAGPVRALVRDVVDGRRNLAVVVLPVALLLVVTQLLGGPLYRVVLRIWTVTLLVVVFELVQTGVLLRRRLRVEFPDEGRLRGHIGYGLIRSTVVRRFRMPPPRVAPPRLRRR